MFLNQRACSTAERRKLSDIGSKNNRSRPQENKIFEFSSGNRNAILMEKEKELELRESTAKQSQRKGKERYKISKNNFYSAPVSTKENGIVTKFKFKDK
jgi:hypothetical protein